MWLQIIFITFSFNIFENVLTTDASVSCGSYRHLNWPQTLSWHLTVFSWITTLVFLQNSSADSRRSDGLSGAWRAEGGRHHDSLITHTWWFLLCDTFRLSRFNSTFLSLATSCFSLFDCCFEGKFPRRCQKSSIVCEILQMHLKLLSTVGK